MSNNDPLGTPNVFLGADPKRPYVSIGLPHAVRRWEFMLHDHEDESVVTSKEWVAEMLKDHVPDPHNLSYIRRRVFTHHGRVAGSFRKGRQLIAGDAAHLMPVWMGQGWNSGMRDATNLGWKLTSVLTGTAGEDHPGHLHLRAQGPRQGHGRFVHDPRLGHQDHQPVGRRRPRRRFLGAQPLPLGQELLLRHALQADAALHLRRAGRSHHPGLRQRGGEAHQQVDPGPDREQQGLPGRRAVPAAARELASSVENLLLDDVIGNWWTVLVWGNNPKDVLPPSHSIKASRPSAPSSWPWFPKPSVNGPRSTWARTSWCWETTPAR